MSVTRGFRGQRGIAALLTLIWLAAPAAATGPATADPDLAYNVPCAGPATTPYCASRTWADCFAKLDPRLCQQVGFKIVRFPEYPNVDVEALRNAPYPKITGIRKVTPKRFQVIGAPDYRVPAELIGTHEVRIKLEICGPKIKCAAQASEF